MYKRNFCDFHHEMELFWDRS